MFMSSTYYTIKKLSLTIISERVIIWLIYYYTIFATTTLFRLFELFGLLLLFGLLFTTSKNILLYYLYLILLWLYL